MASEPTTRDRAPPGSTHRLPRPLFSAPPPAPPQLPRLRSSPEPGAALRRVPTLSPGLAARAPLLSFPLLSSLLSDQDLSKPRRPGCDSLLCARLQVQGRRSGARLRTRLRRARRAQSRAGAHRDARLRRAAETQRDVPGGSRPDKAMA